MSDKKHIVLLSAEERTALEKLSTSDRSSIREKTRARILLSSDVNRSREQGGSLRDEEIAARLKVSVLSMSQIRGRAQERGAVASIHRQGQKN